MGDLCQGTSVAHMKELMMGFDAPMAALVMSPLESCLFTFPGFSCTEPKYKNIPGSVQGQVRAAWSNRRCPCL